MLPGKSPDQRRGVSMTANPAAESESPLMKIALGNLPSDGSSSSPGMARTDRAGIYEAWPRTIDGKLEVRRFAVNVDPREGNLALVDSQDLAESLAATDVELLTAEDMASVSQSDSGISWSQTLLGLLAILLIGEQLLAYSASYHPGKSTPKTGVPRKGAHS